MFVVQTLIGEVFQEQVCSDMWGSPEPEVEEHFMTPGFYTNVSQSVTWVWISSGANKDVDSWAPLSQQNQNLWGRGLGICML